MKLNVTAKVERFRRAGFEFGKTAKPVDVDEKTAAILQAEPMLVVEVAADAPPPGPQLNAADTIEKIKAVSTVEELDALIKGDERKSVLAAADKRRAELAQ